MGTQKKIAAQIIRQQGDYVLALKENHETLYQEVELYFQGLWKRRFKGTSHCFCETVDGDHGRIETRKYWTIDEIDWMEDQADWAKLTSIGMVQSTREVKGETSQETRYYLNSLPSDAKIFANAVRSHWGIENSLHWILDVAFREDESRIRKDYAPENFSILRRIALNLLKKETSLKAGIKIKRNKAGWDNGYLTKVLTSLNHSK